MITEVTRASAGLRTFYRLHESESKRNDETEGGSFSLPNPDRRTAIDRKRCVKAGEWVCSLRSCWCRWNLVVNLVVEDPLRET